MRAADGLAGGARRRRQPSRSHCGRRSRPSCRRSRSIRRRSRPSARRRSCGSSTSGPAPPAPRWPRPRPATARGVAGWPSSTRRACRRATTGPGSGSASRSWRAGTAPWRRASRPSVPIRGFELLGRRPGPDRRAGRAQGDRAARRRPGAGRGDDGGGRRRLRRRPLPRDDRSRTRGRRRAEGRQRLRGPDRREGGRAAAQRLRRRQHAARVGDGGDRRRGDAMPEDGGDRGGRVSPPTSTTASAPPRRHRVDRQRSPGELPRPPDPPHDQHLHRAGRRRPAGDDLRGRPGLLRGLLRRRPGRAGDRRLRLRRLRGLSDRGRQGDEALPRCHPDRQLPPGAGADRRGRIGLRDEDGLLRQGGADSARSGPARATSGSVG